MHHAPHELLKHWNVVVGNLPDPKFAADDGHGLAITGDDVQVWLEEVDKERFRIHYYCEKALPMLMTDPAVPYRMLSSLTDHILGELTGLRYIVDLNVLITPRSGECVLLSKLPDKLAKMGFMPCTDPADVLKYHQDYRSEPVMDPKEPWRSDIAAGTSACPSLPQCYSNNISTMADMLHGDGVLAGFLCYPLESLIEGKSSQKLMEFQTKLNEALSTPEAEQSIALLGTAAGLYYGYLDFIAWDSEAAYEMFRKFFYDCGMPWAYFHSFRREAGTVVMRKEAPEFTKDYVAPRLI